MRQRDLVVPIVLGTLLVTVGCATKKFVRGEIQKSETKTEQQVGRVETELKADLTQEKTRVTGVASEVTQVRGIATDATKRADQAATKAEEATGRAGQAIAKADGAAGKAEEATGRAGQAIVKADEATGKAGQAIAKADETDNRLTRLWSGRNKQTLVETVVITFGFDKWELDDKGQTALLDLVRQVQGNPNVIVNLEGYTDNMGPAPYNLQLSQRRAEAVRRFLVDKGVDLHRVQSIGLGDTRPQADNRTKQGRDQNRRVAVKLFALAD
ncbi:MAG: OmpA family protein [Candidatus Rokuibacteriota bacterium]